MKRQNSKVVKRTGVIVICATVLLAAFLFLWTYIAEHDAHYTPDYPKEDIAVYLERENLSQEEYDILYRQTGLSRAAVDSLRKENRIEVLLAVQERFFAEVDVVCEGDFLLFGEKLGQQEPAYGWIDDAEEGDADTEIIPVLETGDILISFNSHFLGWRNGHAAVVIDAEKGLTLEALTLGKNSTILSLDSWLEKPSFVVLRLRGATQEQRAEIAAYAEQYLIELPYRLTAGIWRSVWEWMQWGKSTARASETVLETEADITGTHCAHLIWYAYNQFGYDLDSDGGLIVTPRDLYESPLLEIIQIYGMMPVEKVLKP